MGSPVEAAHKHVRKFKDGHEKYNFLRGPDGRFYAYAPPVGGFEVAPKPRNLEGWLVFSVAKSPHRPGLYLTGWYEDATFEGTYTPRPEYLSRRTALPLDAHGGEFSYTLSADDAVQIDPNVEPFVFPGDHMKRSPIYYLRGNGEKAEWCAKLAQKLLAVRRRYLNENRSVEIRGAGSGSGGICSDPERRKEVEEAAVTTVKKHFPKSKFEIDDRQMDKCGFDLLVRSKSDPRDELHIEVKGTQNANPHFLMSHREYAYMLANVRHWRLAMVTNALTKSPKLEILNAQEAQARFFWKEFTWHATAKP
ncbi:hypothetical protein FG91_01661 [Sphingopyxis sp. LC81]|nr:hypothetical protein FG91_01661 [Sphingopyxis sp. LC81]